MAAIQNHTQTAVTSITSVMRQITEYQAAIAAVVEQQSPTTAAGQWWQATDHPGDLPGGELGHAVGRAGYPTESSPGQVCGPAFLEACSTI